MARDLPPVPEGLDSNLAQLLRRMREEMRTLAASGLSGGGSGSGGSNTTIIVGSGGGGGTTPDLTAPPDVTSLAAFAAFSNILVTWSGITYSQGHGHKQTLIYGVQKEPSDATLPTFGDAQLIATAPDALTMIAIPSEMNTRWHIWAKFKTVDGELSTNPVGGTNGVTVTTGQDITHLLDTLTQAAEDPLLPYTKLTLKADFFYISDNDGLPTQFFNVVTTPITVDGITVPPGVYMKDAFIANGQIKNAMIGNAVIDDAKIITLSAAKFTGGEMRVGSLLQSTNFLPVGSSGFPSGRGWRIRADGTADFQAANIHGTLTADQIDGTGLSIKDLSGNLLIDAGATPWLRNTLRVGSPVGQTLAEIEAGTVGPAGANGSRTAVMRLYQWGSSAPSAPSGSSTYTWATALFTNPSGVGSWTQSPGVPAAGQTLYVAEKRYADTDTTSTTSITWASASVFVGGRSGESGIDFAVTGYGETFGIYSTNPWNGGVDDANAAAVIAAIRGTATLVIGDTVVLRTAGNTAVETRYWSGSGWAVRGVTMSGNLLVGGTISGQTNFNVSGYAKIEGGASLSIVDPETGSVSTTTCALASNTTQLQVYGVVGYANGAGGSAGVYGFNPNSSAGAGIKGRGLVGVQGFSTSSTGHAVEGVATGGRGCVGFSTSGTGVYGRSISGNAGVYGQHFGSGDGVYGISSSGWGGRFSSLKVDGNCEATGALQAAGLVSINAFVEAKYNSVASAYLHCPLSGGAYLGHWNGSTLDWAVYCDSSTNTTVKKMSLTGMSFGADPGTSDQWLSVNINGTNYRLLARQV